MPLAASGVTHQGRRATNEDSWLVELERGLLVVADGMGGHNAGEVASALAVATIREFLFSGTPPTQASVEQAIQLANDRILEAASMRTEYSGMGTTVVAALILDGQAIYTSVGDSRVYLWQRGRLTQLTRDDSWLAAALDGDDEARHIGTHPMRHVLTKVVGLRPELEATASTCSLGVGDCLLLCSDGVHGAVPHDVLAEIVGSRDDVSDIAQRIVQMALDRGATDNATAVVARME